MSIHFLEDVSGRVRLIDSMSESVGTCIYVRESDIKLWDYVPMCMGGCRCASFYIYAQITTSMIVYKSLDKSIC